MIIGNVDMDLLSKNIFESQKEINKEINYILWSRNDLTNKVQENGSFIQSLTNNAKIWLVGEDNEFDGIVKQTGNKQNKTRQKTST